MYYVINTLICTFLGVGGLFSGWGVGCPLIWGQNFETFDNIRGCVLL